MKIKIQAAKFFQSVRCGSKEFVFIKASETHSIELEGIMITITNLSTNEKVLTSLHNCPWLVPVEEEVSKPEKKTPTSKPKGGQVGQEASPQGSKGNRKKTSKG